jgi:predicted O-methyltransferase YrrM
MPLMLTRMLKELFVPGKTRVDGSPEPVARDAGGNSAGFSYSIDWFSWAIPGWQSMFSGLSDVAKVLEIGSYEGMSAAWLIENVFRAGGKGDLYCIDTWEGGVEHDPLTMPAVEQRFLHNIALARSRSRSQVDIHVLKGTSALHLPRLLAEGNAGSFDAVHVDGSHQCPDVLSDMVLSFALLRIGGLMICDDYVWSMEEHGREDLLNQPKLAIDSFVNCYRRKVSLKAINLRQLYLRKTAD